MIFVMGETIIICLLGYGIFCILLTFIQYAVFWIFKRVNKSNLFDKFTRDNRIINNIFIYTFLYPHLTIRNIYKYARYQYSFVKMRRVLKEANEQDKVIRAEMHKIVEEVKEYVKSKHNNL